MSKVRFENFLLDCLDKWLAPKITVGFRYQFQSPDAANTHRLMQALQERSQGVIDLQGTNLSYTVVNSVKLIYVAHLESDAQVGKGFNENYISMLRDAVAGQRAPLESSALLIIHNSLLDTLINSAEDLAAPGAIWSPGAVRNELETLITHQPKPSYVIRCLLDYQTSLIREEGGSMFGFEPLYRAMVAGDELDLRSLGLFRDRGIADMANSQQIQRRLEENRQLREEIDTVVHHFPDELEERLNYLGEDFIKRYFQSDSEEPWQDLDIQILWDEIDAQKQQALDFDAADSETCQLIGPRNKRETAAGKREKHLIMLVSERGDTFDLKLTFYGRDLDTSQFRLGNNKELEQQATLHIRRSQGKATLLLSAPFSSQSTYFTLRLKRPRNSECYAFHVVVLQQGDFHITAFENQFLVDPRRETLTLQTDTQELCINPDLADVIELRDNDQIVDNHAYGAVNYQTLYEESDVVTFTVSADAARLKFNIEGEVSQESLSLPLLLDAGRFNLLFNDHYNGSFTRDKVVIDHKETRIIGARLKLLEKEEEMLEDECLWLGANSLPEWRLEVYDPCLYQAWQGLIAYFKRQKTLPSLASWGDEMVQRVRTYVSAYLDTLRDIPLGQNLSPESRMLLKLGLAEFDGKEYFTPFHPLVLSYYLYLVERIQSDKAHRSFRNLPSVTRKRLNPKGLIPYIFSEEHGFGYTQVVEENPFWLEVVPQQDTNYSFVANLVHEKVKEFITTFYELFCHVDDAPLIINSINNGDNRDIFFGLLLYFQEHLDDSRHINVNLYDDALCETELDRFAELGTYDEIKNAYGLDRGRARENINTVIDLLRTRLSFSKFQHEEVEAQAYAHLTFFKNNQKIERVENNIDNHISGVACDGLLNGESSSSAHGSHYTAFGLRNVDIHGRPHLELARLIGTLLQPARMPHAVYHEHSAVGLAVSESFKELLSRSYDSSLWTTIIDPKVTLEFFYNTRDLVLIHYSDQYTNSAGYDAITVTRRTDLYSQMLGRGGNHVVGEFNAFNGEWLLKMVTAPETIRLERRGIVGAWKLVSCLLANSDITWVPLSVAEMIRVSGNIGLTMSEGDFARYHKGDRFKGRISDDIVFVGFKDRVLYLLPVEVKTGARPDFEKAREQAQALGRYLAEILGPLTLESHLYRGLFVRQVLLQVEKYQLYDVFNSDYFDPLLSTREDWLRGDYTLGVLEGYPQGMVVAHLDSPTSFQTQCKTEEGIAQLEIPISYLDTLVNESRAALLSKLVDDNLLHIHASYFLGKGGRGQALVSKTNRQGEAIDTFSTPDSRLASQTEPSWSKQLDQPGTAARPIEDVEDCQTETVPDLQQPMRIQFGTDVMSRRPVYWEPTNTAQILNPNTAVIGTMGTGKTQFTKSLVTQLMRNQQHNVDGQPIGVLILDYKADYVKPDFVEPTNAKVYELYNLPFNPFTLFGDKPRLPIRTANLFRSTLATAYGLGNRQQSRIRALVMEAYEKAGIHPDDRSTWGRPAPTLHHVWELFMSQDKVEEDSLYVALDDLSNLQIFEPDPEKTQSLYDLIDGVTVINLSGQNPPIPNLVVAMILDIFYSQMHQQGSSKIAGKYRQLSKFILVDEADNFMRQDFPSLRMVMKEGREFGVGTILSTQEMSHFKTGENDYSSYILSWIIHRVSRLKTQDIQAVFNTSNKRDEDHLMSQIRELDKHHALYVNGEKRVKKIKDLAFWELLL